MAAKATARLTTASEGRSSSSGKDIPLSDREFDQIRDIIRELTGINMSEAKRELVYRRVSARLKANNIRTFQGYIKFLKQADPVEIEAFSNAVTTNLTSFYREQHHFEFLANTVIPEIVAKKGTSSRRLRIWSSGCSTGEEPYSIAITLRESFKELARWDAKVLCTDLDSNVLDTCKAGVYAKQRVEKIPQQQLQRWFQKHREPSTELFKVSSKLQELLMFKQLNLMHDWPMKGRFDVIFCRNVIIYFDKPTQRILMDRYANIIEDGGYLILGHSESLFKVTDRFKLLGNTIYQKIK